MLNKNENLVPNTTISDNIEEVSNKTPSFGEKLAGITFNPSGDTHVNNVKLKAAQFMDAIMGAMPEKIDTQIQRSLFESAQIRALEAQMLAVKAITWKY